MGLRRSSVCSKVELEVGVVAQDRWARNTGARALCTLWKRALPVSHQKHKWSRLSGPGLSPREEEEGRECCTAGQAPGQGTA